jgi:2'-hydroxyisoflavone reductase
MPVSRRTAIKHSLATVGSLALFTGDARASQPTRGRAGRVLFLGGTGFLGPHMVQRALEKGYQVTLLTRGRAGRELFPGVERLIGDRGGDMSALRGKTWDVVIDNSGYVPAHVRTSAELLKGSVGHYIYTSTIDAYRDFHTTDFDEDYPLAQLPEGAPHNPNRYYGPLKALCEREVQTVFPTSFTIVRPAWVSGPGDNNHLFTYWVMRVKRGGELLVPGERSDPFQTVDVRDLAAFVINAAERRIGGHFNAAAPSTTFGEMLDIVQRATSSNITPVWVSAEFLRTRNVRPYFDMPLWWPPRNDYAVTNVPSGLGGGIGAFRISGERARENGMTYRPLADTARDLLAWYEKEHGTWPETGRPGLTTERERTLLAEWKREQAFPR